MRRILLALVIFICNLTPISFAADQTHSTLPQQNSSFMSDLSLFLQREDAQRYIEHFVGMVVSGGVDATGGTLTHTPTSLTAYPGGYYITETGTVTYIANSTCYLIANRVLTGNLSTFQRQAGTHYLTDCTSPSKPALPADSLWLATVVTNGSSVTTYTDLRTRVPYAGSYPLADIPSAGVRGRIVLITDVNSGTLYWDNGAAWKQIALNPMTQAGDVVVGGTSGAPTRLALGTANQLLGVNGSATTLEYKTMTAGDGISVTNSTGVVTISAIAATPAGTVVPYVGTSAPVSWLLCDATAYTASTYPTLAAVLIPSASVFGRGTAVGTFTVDTATDVVTLASHGLIDGQIAHVASTTTLPAGLSANTVYYIRDSTSSTFRLSTTSGGNAVDITTTGSGTHSIYDEIQVPDMRSRVPMGVGTGTFVSNFVPGNIDTGTDVITVPANTTFGTGMAVVFNGSASSVAPTGLTFAVTYYIIYVSPTTVKLATSYANARAETAVNITAAGSGDFTLTFTPTARTLGEKGGRESHTLTDDESGLPVHSHTLTTATDTTGGGTFVPSNVDSTPASSVTINNSTAANATAAHPTMDPFLALNFIIKQ